MSVTHDEPTAPHLGGSVDCWEWRLDKEGVLIDAGYASQDEDDPTPWRWWLVQQGNGRFFVGLPGLEVSRRVLRPTRLDREKLDGAILQLLRDHGI